jgi:hypothetical protein
MGRPAFSIAAKLRKKMADARDAGRHGERWHSALQGRKAFDAGLSPVNNPYVLGEPEWVSWHMGWLAGYDRRFL